MKNTDSWEIALSKLVKEGAAPGPIRESQYIEGKLVDSEKLRIAIQRYAIKLAAAACGDVVDAASVLVTAAIEGPAAGVPVRSGVVQTLRAALDKIANDPPVMRDAAWCADCLVEVESVDEDFCCKTCGTDLVPVHGSEFQRKDTEAALTTVFLTYQDYLSSEAVKVRDAVLKHVAEWARGRQKLADTEAEQGGEEFSDIARRCEEALSRFKRGE